MCVEQTGKLECSRRRIVVQSAILGALGMAVECNGALAAVEIRALIVGTVESVRPFFEALSRRQKSIYFSSSLKDLTARRGSAVYLALGPASLSVLLDANIDEPILSVFVSSQTFNQLVLGKNVFRSNRVAAIFAECSPDAQLELARAIFQRRVSVGVLLSSATAYLEAVIRQAALKHDIDISVLVVPEGANPVRELSRLPNVAAMLAIPDGAIFNGQTLRGLLESTYRRGQAIIGFSTSMVDAGILATAYSAIDDVAAQVVESVQSISRDRVPESQYPLYWRVQVNKQVARSLNIAISDSVFALGSQPRAR